MEPFAASIASDTDKPPLAKASIASVADDAEVPARVSSLPRSRARCDTIFIVSPVDPVTACNDPITCDSSRPLPMASPKNAAPPATPRPPAIAPPRRPTVPTRELIFPPTLSTSPDRLSAQAFDFSAAPVNVKPVFLTWSPTCPAASAALRCDAAASSIVALYSFSLALTWSLAFAKSTFAFLSSPSDFTKASDARSD